MENYVKRFIKKDGSQRISFYRDDYAENPRYNTDEPLHCNDWDRNHSIMTKSDDNMQSASDRIIQLLAYYGKHKEIINKLVENGKHMTDGKADINNALVYDRSNRRWILMEWAKWFGEKDYEWREAEWFDGKKEDIDFNYLLECCFDTTIDEFCNSKYWTDGVKIMSYSFGYYGGMSFSDTFDTDSTGLCWLEKEEFLKYAGGDNSEWVKKEEQVWKEKSLDEIEFLLDELKAWGDNDVYGFFVEDCIKYKVHKEYTNVDKEDEDYEEEEWNEIDSCCGFYGSLDKRISDMFETAGLDINEFEEEK